MDPKRPVMYVLDAAGNPVPEFSPLAYAEAMMNNDPHIAREERGQVEVSTVFLGMDHDWTRKGPPILYETMVFGGVYTGLQLRYSTRAEALAGHAKIVAEVFGENN
jgi:hypothetical protein